MGDSRNKKADEKIIEEAIKRFDRAEEAERDNREQALEDLKFSMGEQWPENIRRDRENDPDGARPCLVVDKLNQYVRQIVNDSRQNRPAIKTIPADDKSDSGTAEVIQGMCRYIENNSSADIAYDIGIEMCVRAGFGFLRVITQYDGDESFNQEPIIEPVYNPFSAYIDCDAKKIDGSDAKWGIIFEDMPREEFEATYPKADACSFTDSRFASKWVKEGTVRIAEYFRIEEEKYDIWQNYDGTISYTFVEGAPTRKATRSKVMWYKLTAAEIIERQEFPGVYIPLIPIYGHVIDIAGKRKITGLIHPAIDGQRMYNYSVSAYIERVALVPKAPFIAAEGQLEGHEKEWQEANTANIPVLTYKPTDFNGQLVPPPQRQAGADVPTGWLQAVQMTEHDIQSALGMYNASIGAPSNERTGKAIMARAHESDVSTFHFPDNLARSIRHLGRIIVGIIPKLFDTRRTVRILGEDGKEDTAMITPEIEVPMLERRDSQGAIIDRIYNVGVGKYDVVVTVGPSFHSKRQEAADFMTQVVQTHPQLLQVIGDLMFKAMDLPYSDKIAKRLEAMIPQQVKDSEKGEVPNAQSQIPPEIQQMLQMADQNIGQLQEALKQAHDQLGQMGEKVNKAQIDSRKLDIEEFEAETDRLRLGIERIAAMEAQENKGEGREDAQEAQALQEIISRIDQLTALVGQPQQQPVQVIVGNGQQPVIKRGRAIKQEDGSWAMETVEEPVQQEQAEVPGG